MRLVITPLREEYQVVNLRTTQLESFLNPPEYIQPDKEKQNRTFDIGHAMGTTIQCYGMNKETLETNLYIYNELLGDFEWMKYLGEVEMEGDLTGKFGQIEFVSCSNKYTLEIEFGGYLFHIDGESDVLGLMDGKLFMGDIKSAASRWSGLEKKIQCTMYPLMLEQLLEPGTIEHFYYFIFLKNKKKGVCQVLRYNYSREQSIKDLTYYLSRYINENTRNSKDANIGSNGHPILGSFRRVSDGETMNGH